MAILDAAGNEIIRHGASGFLGEMNLLSGQTVFLTAVVTQPLRYVAVDRDDLRPLLFEDGPLSDLLLSTFIARREALQQVQGVGLEVVGPHSSEATMGMVEFARSNRLPFTWRDTERADDEAAAALVAGLDATRPAARATARRRRAPRPVDRSGLARAGDRPRARAPRGGRPGRGRRRPRGPRRRGLRRVRGPRDPRRREHRARRAGGHVPQNRELPRVPGRDHRLRADQPRGHAGAQVRSAHGVALPRRLARAGRRRALRGAPGRGPRDRSAHGADRDRRAVPAPPRRRTLGATRE